MNTLTPEGIARIHTVVHPTPSQMRTFAYPFRHCNFLHISASEHGFLTNEFFFQVYLDGDPYPVLVPFPDYFISRCHALEIRLIRNTLDVESPTGMQTQLLPDPSGTVVITGPA
jgi:hypothetical protein